MLRFLLLLPFLFFPLTVSAHPSGISYESESGPYLMDLGYDPTTFNQGESTVFDFNIYSGKDKTPVPAFDNVWVRIESKEHGTVLATGIRHAGIGPTTLMLTPPFAGVYTISTSYRDKEGEEIAASEFPFTVAKEAGSLLVSLYYVLAFVCGALAAVLSTLLLSRLRSGNAGL